MAMKNFFAKPVITTATKPKPINILENLRVRNFGVSWKRFRNLKASGDQCIHYVNKMFYKLITNT